MNVLKYLQPSAIFSAHDHRGMDYIGTRKTGRSTGNITVFSQNKPDSEPDFLVLKQIPSLDTGMFFLAVIDGKRTSEGSACLSF